MIIVNGKQEDFVKVMDLQTYLQQHNYPLTKIAVELNGNIIPKAKYSETMLKLNDKLEIVTFVGGG